MIEWTEDMNAALFGLKATHNGIDASIKKMSCGQYYWCVDIPNQLVSRPRNKFQWGECRKLETAKAKVAALLGAAK
jgi:hypothetical protein